MKRVPRTAYAAIICSRATRATVVAAVTAVFAVRSARATVSLDVNNNVASINSIVGADRWYNQGYFGQFSVVANVEAGSVWNGHETTNFLSQTPDAYFKNPVVAAQQVQQTAANGSPVFDSNNKPVMVSAYPHYGDFDYHATAVGQVIAGRTDFGNPLKYYQIGVAPLTSLRSGAIATTFTPVDSTTHQPTGSFDYVPQSFTYAYVQAMAIARTNTTVQPFILGPGVTAYSTVAIQAQKADVVNSSWGGDEPTGSIFETKAIDALVAANHTTFVAAAGNSGPLNNTVGFPASGYNKIAVAALANNNNTVDPYKSVTTFSSRGLNNFYNPHPTGAQAQVVPSVRPVVDIAAPGDSLAVAYYGGITGSNTGPGAVDQTAGTATPDGYYLTGAAGTSFAAPLVSGGAALLDGYARNPTHTTFGGGTAVTTDARVIKAVLVNSAEKTKAWNNAQAVGTDAVIRTAQGLDAAVGAGRLNLDRAYDQYVNGTANAGNGGTVQAIGWALGHVVKDSPNDYVIPTLTSGQTLTATLNWFIHRTYTDASAPTTPDPNAPTLTGDAAAGAYGGTATDDRFDNLFLQVWRLNADGSQSEIAESAALYNNVQHLSFTTPSDGAYAVRVLWAGRMYDASANPSTTPNAEDYAVAWSNLTVVPEPSLFVLLPGGFALLMRRPPRGRFRGLKA